MDRRRRHVDLAVVGGGIVGLAATLVAADAGLEVRCFERSRPGAGQSAGRTRVFRHLHRDWRLLALAIRARAGWDAWEARFGRVLVGREGAVVAGSDLAGGLAILRDAGVEVRELAPQEQGAALPIAATLGDLALLDVRGGAIRAHEAVEALASALGQRIVPTEVTSVHPDDAGALVATTEGIWRARRVLICAGVDTARLAAPLGIEVPVRTSCHVRVTFAVRDGRAGATLPCLLDRRDDPERAYASPSGDGLRDTVGLLNHDVEVDRIAPAVPQGPWPRDALERTIGYVRALLPGLDPDPVGHRIRWATKLPWDDDAFATWRAGAIIVFAGGNLFKMAPVLGRCSWPRPGRTGRRRNWPRATAAKPPGRAGRGRRAARGRTGRRSRRSGRRRR